MGSAELVQDLILGGASILFLGRPGEYCHTCDQIDCMFKRGMQALMASW